MIPKSMPDPKKENDVGGMVQQILSESGKDDNGSPVPIFLQRFHGALLVVGLKLGWI